MASHQCWDDSNFCLVSIQLFHMIWLDSDWSVQKSGLTRDSRREAKILSKFQVIKNWCLLNCCCTTCSRHADVICERKQSFTNCAASYYWVSIVMSQISHLYIDYYRFYSNIFLLCRLLSAHLNKPLCYLNRINIRLYYLSTNGVGLNCIL